MHAAVAYLGFQKVGVPFLALPQFPPFPPPLEVDHRSSYGIRGSVVSSASGVWDGASAKFEFGDFLP